MDEPKMYSNELTVADAAQQMVTDIEFETGWLNMPPDFADMTEADGERIETIDCMVVHFKTADGKTRTFTFTQEDVVELTIHMMSWINDLHRSGKCGCGAHG